MTLDRLTTFLCQSQLAGLDPLQFTVSNIGDPCNARYANAASIAASTAELY